MLGYNSLAQYSVEGSVIDIEEKAVPYANVLLYKQADSTLTEVTVSEIDGRFNFKKVEEDNYFIEVSFVGYKKANQKISVLKNIVLPPIILETDEEYLDEVTLRLKKPKVYSESDRIVFDIENTSLSSGNTWDVLKKTPGVISLEGDLKVRNTSATIYINEKKVDLTSDELQQLLEGYSAENIKQVEVIRNPSAKYDAGDGPIINIITSKMLIPGYKGSVNANYTQAIFAKYSVGTSHYYKTENLSVFGNYSFSPAKRFKQDDSYINFINEDDEVFQRWRTDFDRTTREESHNINLMLDYSLNENNSVSFSATGLYSPDQTFCNNGETNIYDDNFQLDSLFITHSHLESDLANIAYDLGYRHNFNEKSVLSANLHSTYYEEDKTQRVTTDYFSPQSLFFNNNRFFTDAAQKIDIYAGQLDFETRFGEYSFASGVKYSDINSSSFIAFEDVESNAAPFQNNYLSDRFTYDEAVYAAYSSVAKDWEKFGAKVGLRVEHTDREGYSFSLNQLNEREYTELFPSIYLSYKAAEKHSFAFDYGRKINRPRYESLNPFRYFVTENSYQSGNPNLRAAISNSFNLNYTFNNKYSFDFYYRDNGRNPVGLPFQDNEELFLRSIQANVLDSKSYGIDFFHGRSVKEWWYAQAVLSAYHEEETFLAVESNFAEVTNEINGLYASIYNGITLSKDGSFTGDITFFYMSAFLSGSYKIDSRSNLSFGVNKKIWNKRGEISLHVGDIFNDFAPQLNSTYLNQDNGYYALPENRYVRIGFKYNFGNFGLSDNSRSIDAEERDRL